MGHRRGVPALSSSTSHGKNDGSGNAAYAHSASADGAQRFPGVSGACRVGESALTQPRCLGTLRAADSAAAGATRTVTGGKPVSDETGFSNPALPQRRSSTPPGNALADSKRKAQPAPARASTPLSSRRAACTTCPPVRDAPVLPSSIVRGAPVHTTCARASSHLACKHHLTPAVKPSVMRLQRAAQLRLVQRRATCAAATRAVITGWRTKPWQHLAHHPSRRASALQARCTRGAARRESRFESRGGVQCSTQQATRQTHASAHTQARQHASHTSMSSEKAPPPAWQDRPRCDPVRARRPLLRLR